MNIVSLVQVESENVRVKSKVGFVNIPPRSLLIVANVSPVEMELVILVREQIGVPKIALEEGVSLPQLLAEMLVLIVKKMMTAVQKYVILLSAPRVVAVLMNQPVGLTLIVIG